MQHLHYISGGLLGDFIHQLGIIECLYNKTGRKGILYISNSVGDRFRIGLERAYADTYPFLKSLEYLEEYSIHAGQAYDINLSCWRSSPLLYHANWHGIFQAVFKVDWGRRPWLHISTKRPELAQTILVNCSNYTDRVPRMNMGAYLASFGEGQDIRFIAQNPEEHAAFCRNTGTSLSCLLVNSLEDFVISIASCKQFIGNLSSPLAIAQALHVPNIMLLSARSGDTVHQLGMEAINPSIQIYKV